MCDAMALASLANFLGLSLLLCSSIGVSGAHHSPYPPPPPQHHDGAPPPPPSHPPMPPPRKKVAVQGYVYCRFCVMEGGPGSEFKSDVLPGAVVKLQCNNTRQGWEEETTTDNKGSFEFRPKKVTTWGAHKCKVVLVSSPRPDCPIIDEYYFDQVRIPLLKPIPTNTTSPFQLFTVGPLGAHPGPYMCL